MRPTHIELPRLVRRISASHLVLNVLIAFGATVLIVRLYLELTGYPRLGNATLHIAHLLYGGIVLAAASLLMIVFASPTTTRIGAILTGIGLGLFFDEVGKFITTNNDYFYKPAAPIIYLIALAIALLYFLLRRRAKKPSDGELMVAALESTEVLLEGRQTAQQRRRVDLNLNRLTRTMADPDYVKLALALREFADSEAVRPGRSGVQRLWARAELWGMRLFVRHQKVIATSLLVLLALNSLLSLVTFSVSLVVPVISPELARDIQSLYNAAGLRAFSPFLLSVSNIDLLLDFITALITLVGIVLFVTRRREQGLFWVQLALLLQLCVVNVFTFYVEQFSAALLTLANLIVLLCVRAYQHNLKQALVARRHLAQMSNTAPLTPTAASAKPPEFGNTSQV